MNKEQAKQLIEDTFEKPFNKDKFKIFISNLLNRIEALPFTYKGKYIPDSYKQHIATLERIGKYAEGKNEIDILIVKLKKETSLERARTMQRNFIAWYLKGSRGGKLKDAALVAFVSPAEEDWRFSLVKMDYQYEQGKSGRVKVKEEFTPAHRWSFLVGINEKSHTAQSRLVPILEDDEHNPTLTRLEETFNIEPVTKEFFEKYRNLLIRTVDALDSITKRENKVRTDFELKNINTVDFAKKLLGQIVFLYFLQKKGWFGVKRDQDWGSGSKHFLRELFEKKHSDYRNFFNDILESLFYEALRYNRSYDDHYFSYFKCKIPFLNGGLFEPINDYDWKDTDIELPNELFSNKNITPEGDEGDGIFDVFDRFNFTVKEDEPLEKEVAIDPELLGKLYEKFNAIRPDNFYEYKKALASGKKTLEKKFNKQYGVYYTPREIVHYMCQQSLINYLTTELSTNPVISGHAELVSASLKEDIEKLIKYGEQFAENEAVVIEKGKETKTYKYKLPESIRKNAKIIDEKLKDIKVCDPAVGSGAFPVGMMSEIVKTRNVLTVYLQNDSYLSHSAPVSGSSFESHSEFISESRNPYKFKRDCIENSLYGVDIDPGAVEMTKLRLWLSLVVDEEDIKRIKPLPNLDYKIMQGNSLISEFLGINFDIDKDEQQGSLRFEEGTDPLIKQFDEKKNKFLNEFNKSKRENLRQEIENLIINIFEEKLKKQRSDYFSQLKYIEEKYSKLPNEEQRNKYIVEEKAKLYKKTGFNLEEVEKQLKEYTSGRKIRPFFPWRLYFAEVFYQKGGFDVVIANPPYVRQEEIKDQKESLKRQGYDVYNSTSDLYTYFYERSWKILKPEGFSCFISSNKWMRAKYGEKLRRFFKIKTTLKQIIDFNGYQVFDATVDTDILLFQKIKPSGNIVIILNIQPDFTPSTDITNYFNSHKLEMKQSDFDSNCFTFGDETTLNLKKRIEQRGIPLKNWDVNIYRGITTGLNEVFIVDGKTKNELVKRDKKSLEILKPILRGKDVNKWFYEFKGFYLIYTYTGIDIKKYQAIYDYLEQYRSKLEQVWEAKYGKKNWYELRGCDYYSEFEKEKIVWREIVQHSCFTWDSKNYFGLAKVFVMTGKENNKFLLAILNSKLGNFAMKKYYSPFLGTKASEFKKEWVQKMPIPKISDSNQKPFIEIVDRILSLAQSDDYLENPKKQEKVEEYQNQIDQMVYKLYGLTEKEVKVIEESIKEENGDKNNFYNTENNL